MGDIELVRNKLRHTRGKLKGKFVKKKLNDRIEKSILAHQKKVMKEVSLIHQIYYY